jgi:hypothetical protein
MITLVTILVACIPWFVVIFIRDPYYLLFTLLFNFSVVTHWNYFGGCILNHIENNGSKYSSIQEWGARTFGIEPRDFSKGSSLITIVSPSFAIAGILCSKFRKRIRPSSLKYYTS